jgi:hypothetical protein
VLLHPLGIAGLAEIYPLPLAQPSAIDRILQSGAGLVWLAEIDPFFVVPAARLLPMTLGSLASLGKTGLQDAYQQPYYLPDPAPTEQHLTSSSAKAGASNRLRIDRLRISRELPQTMERLSGFVHETLADVYLDGSDGGLDYLFTSRILRDRPFRLKMAVTSRQTDGIEVPPELGTFQTVFAGRVQNAEINTDGDISIRVADGFDRLDRPIQLNTYYGTGGADGDKSIEGKPKPLNYGTVVGAEPTLVDPLKGIWQIHDGEFLEVLVKDRGTLLNQGQDVATYAALEALTGEGETDTPDIPLGTYATCRQLGYFRLAGWNGPVTCDVAGDGLYDGPILWRGGISFRNGIGWRAPGERTHRKRAGGLIYRILFSRAGYTNDELNLDGMLQFDALYPFDQGYSVPSGARPSVRDVCTAIADSVGAIVLRNRFGQVDLRALNPPGAASFVKISDATLISPVERVALPWGAPFAAIQVAYAPTDRPLTEDEVSPELDDDTKATLQRKNRQIEIADPTLTILLPDRAPLLIETRLRDLTAAQQVAARLLAFYARRQAMYRMTADGIAFRADLLSTVVMDVGRFGLTGNVPMLVIANDEQPADISTGLLLL